MIRKNKAGRTYIGLLCACVLAVGVIAGLATDTRQWDIYSGTNDLVVPGTLTITGGSSVTYTNLGPTTAITNVVVVTGGLVSSVSNIGP
jgi:hypothetical protein